MKKQDDLAARLEEVRAKRGYLLPHHGLMALTAPKLLEAYDAAYTALALDDRVLNHHDREFVWLAILIATDEAIATHHIPKFLNAGGTKEEIEAILRVTATALGVEAYRFVENHWRAHLPGVHPREAFLDAISGAGGGASSRLVQMAAVAVHTCKANWDALAWQIPAAYAAGVPEADLAEALSLTMFPGSVPHFVEAARVWRALILDGSAPASPAFRAWAELSGQGGHSEASAAQKAQK